MLGTSLGTKGGISSVIRSYVESGLMQECNIKYISTHADGGKLLKLFIALQAYTIFISTLIFKPVSIVHIHSASRNSFYRKTIFIIISKLFRKKVIFHLHGGGFKDIFYDKASIFLRKFIIGVINSVDLVIVLSDRWKEQMVAILGEGANITVLYNSVIKPKKVFTKGLSSEPVILFLGLICREKGIKELVLSSSILQDKIPHKLKIAGDGEIKKYRELVVENKIDDSTEFLGWVNSKEKELLLREASVLVLPSYNEGLPMCILEALSYGIPVIATPVGGIPDVIDDGNNGFLVSVRDPVSLADKLFELLTNENLYGRMSKNAIITIDNSFSMDGAKRQLKNIYANLGRP